MNSTISVQPVTKDKPEKKSESQDEKKKPGRPRKTPIKGVPERLGILAKPFFKQDNILEMCCYTPVVLKKIFTVLKNMNISDLHIKCIKTGMQFISKDHDSMNEIILDIVGSKLHAYYCEEPFNIYISSDSLKNIFQTIDKSNNQIIFYSERNNYDSKLFLVLDENELDSLTTYSINLIKSNSEDIVSGSKLDLDLYPIKLKFPSKFFKKKITDISSFTNTLRFEKRGMEPLQIVYSSENKSIRAESIFKDKKINLQSTVKADDIFTVSILTNTIKPFASCVISNYIEIYIDRKNKMCFRLNVDEGSFIVTIWSSIEDLVM